MDIENRDKLLEKSLNDIEVDMKRHHTKPDVIFKRDEIDKNETKSV